MATDIFPESREEEILVSTINGEEYNKAPESRIEALLLELKEVIEEGGGGGGTTNYNLLQNKPSINSVTLTGDKTSADLGIPTDADLAGKQDVLPVTASGNDVAFNGDIIDGQGNTLSVLAEALTKTASGNPVVISDCAGGKARSLITSINAIQDLHGYDKPWAGGAGKNKLNNTATTTTYGGVTFTVNSDGTVTANGTATETITFNLTNGFTPFPSGNYIINGGVNNNIRVYANPDRTQGYYSGSADSVAFNVSTELVARIQIESGTVCNNVLIKPMIRLSTESDPTFAPYSNICPISGRTETRVLDHGKNFVDIDNAVDFEKYSGGIRNGFEFSGCKGTYTISQSVTTNNVYFAYQTTGGTWVESSITPSSLSATFSGVDGKIQIWVASGATIKAQSPYLQLEQGSTATAYEPYKSSSATISFGQTVYGGTVDFDTGEATVDRAYKVLTTSDYIGLSGNGLRMNFAVSGVRNAASDSQPDDIIQSNGFKAVSSADTYNGIVGISVNTGASINISIGEALTDTTARAFITDNTIQVVYPLATPLTLTLTPTEVQMLKGYNRVTVESGTITLDYVAKAISGNDEEIAPLVGDKATKSYAVNDFIERNDGLYRVTAPIASGASFTANNTVKMSIGEALTYLYNK